MVPAPGAPLPGAAIRTSFRRLRLGGPAESSVVGTPSPTHRLGLEDDSMVRALETRFGDLKRCFAPPRRRRKRGLRAWLARARGLHGPQVPSRIDLARGVKRLHPGSRRVHAATFSGNTDSFSVPELFTMLRASAKSGVLDLALDRERVTFQIAEGRLAAASSTNAPAEERLGALLVSQGVLTRKALRGVLSRQTRLDGQLGVALLRHRLVTSDQLRDAVREQLRRLLRRSHDVGDAAFVFREGEVDDTPEGLRLDLDQLLLEAASACDEESRVDEVRQELRELRPDALGALSRMKG